MTAETAQEGTILKPEHSDLPAHSDDPGHSDVPVPQGASAHSECLGVNSVLSRVGDKWTVLVIMLLRERPRRFNELKRMVGGISQRMLTLTLRGLERDGLVTRTVFPTVPPRVDYELTPLGHGLSHPVMALGTWALEHLPEIETARQAFDARDAPS